MTTSETALLVLAVLLQAPVSFCLGAATRDGRERPAGFLYLALGAGVAVFVGFFSHSTVLAGFAACGLTVVLAHARFMSAFSAADRTSAPDSASFPAPPQPSDASPPLRSNPILAGISFLADLMVITDRIGELRHRRRMRKTEYTSAMRSIPADRSRTDSSRNERPPTHIRINPDRLPPR